MTKKYCHLCGLSVSVTDRYCSGCGTQLAEANDASSSLEHESDNVSETGSNRVQQASTSPESTGTEPPVAAVAPGDAVLTCLQKYIDFTGYASRSEYWWFYLFCLFPPFIAYTFYDSIAGDIVSVLTALLFFLPLGSASVRRLRDAGYNPWLVLIGFLHIPGALILAYMCAQQSVKQSDVSAALIEKEQKSPELQVDEIGNELTQSTTRRLATQVQSADSDKVRLPQKPSNNDFISTFLVTLLVVILSFVLLVIVVSMVERKQKSESAELSQKSVEPLPNLQPVVSSAPAASRPASSSIFSWSPSTANEIGERLKFSNGAEIVVKRSGDVWGAVLQYSNPKQATFEDSAISNDFVSIVGVALGKENTQLAIVKSSCGGVACSWANYDIVYTQDETLKFASIGPALNSNFTIDLELSDGDKKKVIVRGVENGTRNAYGDRNRVDLELVHESWFVDRAFQTIFRNLLGARPEAFFAHLLAREKLASTMSPDAFRELRSFSSLSVGPTKLVGGRYLVFSGCMQHACQSKRSKVLFDGLTGNAWAIWVDLDSGKYWSASSVQWTEQLLDDVRPNLDFESGLVPQLREGRLTLVRPQNSLR